MSQKTLSIFTQIRIKRLLDVVVSTFGLVLLSPLLVAISIAIKLDSKGAAIFRQQRIGRGGRPFGLFKFRTMNCGSSDDAYQKYLLALIESDCNGHDRGLPYRKMKADPRVTRVGSFLRRYYLDELPQLINVFKGEMSLVGPRPHVQLEVDAYTPGQFRRLSIKPGMTGIWQVEGKVECTFNELIQLDLEYIDCWNVALDIGLIIKTILLIFPGGERLLGSSLKGFLKNRRPASSRNILHETDLDSIRKQEFGSVEMPYPGFSDIERGGIIK